MSTQQPIPSILAMRYNRRDRRPRVSLQVRVSDHLVRLIAEERQAMQNDLGAIPSISFVLEKVIARAYNVSV